jgi:pantetheine-phosphate adenylyltransferase
MKRKAMYAGSFDPITNGHVDIIRRSLRIFDEVTVVVAENPRKLKTTLFSVEERMALIRKVFPREKKVRVDFCQGLVMDFARDHGITAMIRGLRAVGDFENEFMMASMNRGLNPKVETVFMVTGRDWFFVSSSILKEVMSFGGDVAEYVPKVVEEALRAKR